MKPPPLLSRASSPYTASRPDEPQLVRVGLFASSLLSSGTLLYRVMHRPLLIIGVEE